MNKLTNSFEHQLDISTDTLFIQMNNVY